MLSNYRFSLPYFLKSEITLEKVQNTINLISNLNSLKIPKGVIKFCKSKNNRLLQRPREKRQTMIYKTLKLKKWDYFVCKNFNILVVTHLLYIYRGCYIKRYRSCRGRYTRSGSSKNSSQCL